MLPAMSVAVLQGVSRSFGRRTVLSGVDLRVGEGELVGVIGPNGGGKSTLLFLMAGLLRPTAGRVEVCGVEAWRLSLTRSGTVGLVTPRPGLYPLLTGRENLLHFAALFGVAPADALARAAPLLESLALTEGWDERVGGWSTGMCQKLSLVRALLLAPRLLLLDEPTANLDPVAAHTFWTEVRSRVDQGLACVLVSHDLHGVEAICDRALLVSGGVRREVLLPRRAAPAPGPLLAAWHEVLGA